MLDDEKWRTLSKDSYYSQASTCLPEMAGEAGEPDSVDSDSDAEACCLVDQTAAAEAVPLCAGLFFYDPCQPESLGEQRRLLPAERMTVRPGGESCVAGARRGANGTEVVEVSPASLIVDVKAAPDDEAKLVCLAGARLPGGRIGRIFLDAGRGVVCEVRRGETAAALVPLQEALSQLFSLETRRRNAELQKYQRQLCSMMMSAQRKRFLGMP